MIVNVSGLLTFPNGPVTVTVFDPAVARSAAAIVAVSRVCDTKVAVYTVAPKLILAPGWNFDPFTVNARLAIPWTAVLGESEVTVEGGPGAFPFVQRLWNHQWTVLTP